MASNTGGDGNDVLGSENFRWNSFVVDRARFADGFFSEADGGEELNGEPANEQLLALDAPAFRLQMGIDRWSSGSQSFLGGDEDNVPRRR